MFLTLPLTVFGYRELCSDLFVGVSGCDQGEDIDFPGCQGFIGGMFGKLEGGLGRKRPLPGMDRTDGLQEFLIQRLFSR